VSAAALVDAARLMDNPKSRDAPDDAGGVIHR
jgi:hypothetical protein